MAFNFLNFGGKLLSSNRCLYDSNIGYEVRLDSNGSVDNWTYYDGIHTYGCWNSFLFGTLYKSYGCIGRGIPFASVAAEYFYIVKIIMKLNIKDRKEGQITPTKGRISWRTTNNTTWNTEKSRDFDINTNTEWNTYTINLSDVQSWQGNVNDLRVYPIAEDGRDGDEFFIKAIEILSNDTCVCNNINCDYYTSYTNNCVGIGKRGYCKSAMLNSYTQGGTIFEYKKKKTYNIIENVNDELLVNINSYGFEKVKIPCLINCSGEKLSGIIAKEISKVDIGGYAECSVEYTPHGEFIIYSGTYASDSTVVIGDNNFSRYINFYDSKGTATFTDFIGSYPASGFRPYSSYKMKTHQFYTLLDSNDKSGFSFDPHIYNVEGGRRDWLSTGVGTPTMSVAATSSDKSGLTNRYLGLIDNKGKTIIDFNHPINASGRIKKIYAALTLDIDNSRGASDSVRKLNQLTNAKFMFFRPMKNGNLRTLPIEVGISNRNHSSGKLYSAAQEYVNIDCDIFLNKGDLIGIYNANVYIGKSITGKEIDASYFQLNGKPNGIIEVNNTTGNGSAGLMLYARSDQFQDRLVLSIDLNKRVNITDIEIVGSPKDLSLDFNVATCLDINWEVDLFGGDHTTGYTISTHPVEKLFFNHPNLAYGKDCLSDGIRTAPDGLAADSFSVSIKKSYESYYEALHEKDGGSGVVPIGAKYFHCNGDAEWLGVYMFTSESHFKEPDFEEDPIAFTIKFPFEQEKLIYKSAIYFKEQCNFRSFGLSTYEGLNYTGGNADNQAFNYIPEDIKYNTPWTKLRLDGIEYSPEDTYRWASMSLYLGENPCIGHAIKKITGVSEVSYDETLAYYTDDGGLQYMAGGVILNNDQFIQATATDWSTIEHEWKPIKAKGFRFYCSSHKSTKICEMELYCQVENVKSSMSSSLSVLYSEYGDYWWPVAGKEGESSAVSFIGDSPRYIDIIVKPINQIELNEIKINISSEDVFMGDKGCQIDFLPEETKVGSTTNSPYIVNFKNTYGKPHDLHVDIGRDSLKDEGTSFFSLMSDDESISNPLIGPDAYYKKHQEYIFKNYNSNVAINCPVYALKNLMQGASAWYTYDRDYSWKSFGQLTGGQNVNFSNLPNMTITTINLPVLSRSKWWKIGFKDQRIVMRVREVQVYYKGEELPVVFYHAKGQDVNFSPNNNTAPHLSNNIVNGSYYMLQSGSYIGIELPGVQEMDQIVIYHDTLLEYENSHDKAGIDTSTALCIHGDGDTYQTDSIVDDSYYEHSVTVVGNGIYCDEGFKDDIYYEFSQDFSDCGTIGDTFSGPDIDNTFWTDALNASIVDGKMRITNSGTIGSITSLDYFNDDFDISVNLNIIGSYTGRGWGCYLQVENDTGDLIRVGRTYHYETPLNRLTAEAFGGAGWETLQALSSSNTSNIDLRLYRAGNTTYCTARENGTWQTLGSSTVVGNSPIKLSLISDLTALASGITIADFDNFSIDKSDHDWGLNTSYDSTFICTSGIGPTGNAYVYNTACYNGSNSSGYKLPEIFTTQSYPIDNEFAFTFDFSFRTSQFLTSPTGTSTDDCGVSIGVLGRRDYDYNSDGIYRLPYLEGAQVLLTRDRIGIAVCDYRNHRDYIFTPLATSARTYFCRFACNGAGHYHCHVWTDTWGGSVTVIDFSIDSTIKWAAHRVGVGAGFSPYSNYPTTHRATGWVSDFDFYCSKLTKHSIIGRSSIKFSGNAADRLSIGYNNSPICNVNKNGLDLLNKKAVIEFFLKFNSLPANHGDIIYLVKSWDDNVRPVSGSSATSSCSWAMTIELYNNVYYWRFYINISGQCVRTMSLNYTPDLHRWTHYYYYRGTENNDASHHVFLINGYCEWIEQSNLWGNKVNTSMSDVVIGQSLDGWIEELRISSDYTPGGARGITWGSSHAGIKKEVPVRKYNHYYTLSIFNSSDNIFYGKDMDVDVLFNTSRNQYMPYSSWSDKYYTYFAIDLGQRYDIDIIRSYPVDTAYSFNRTKNTLFSNKDTSDPYSAFFLSHDEQNVGTDFKGQNYDYPSNWTKNDTVRASSYIIDDMFCQQCSPVATQEYASAKSKFILYGDFDFTIDYDIGTTYTNTNSWEASIQVTDLNDSSKTVKLARSFESGSDQYTMWRKDLATTWTKVFNYYRQPVRGTLRLVRNGAVFSSYVKDTTDPTSTFELLGSYQMLNNYSIESTVEIKLLSDSTTFPSMKVLWDNFTLLYGQPSYSNANDARWVRVKMLNGDGVTRTIKNLDIFPDTTTQVNVVGQHNTYWEPLGPSVTSYTTLENIALGATVSGSSYVGVMTPSKVVDGVINDGDLAECWGSDTEANPWIDIHLGKVEPLFRFKIYHGYSTTDATNIINDYKIQVSDDGVGFSTIFTITGNTAYERTHDLAAPVYAKVVRISVDSYKAANRFVHTGVDGYRFWKGAVLREVEIYKYYDFEIVSSGDKPIIAINLQQPYFISGHALIGPDAEYLSTDWDNSSANFAWSSSRSDNPSKVKFGSWGETPYYSQWVLIKRNTAYDYPVKHDINHSHTDTNDYLKHAIITASYNEIGDKPNPIEYPWMWRSNFSELTSDYNVIGNGKLGSRSLCINYPDSIESEHVRFIEGDHFGWDSACSIRDGYGLNIYIDDINNLDLSYGHLYIGGFDYTQAENPVTFKWNLTTLSGILHSGWNQLTLCFMYADELSYTKISDYTKSDPRRLYSIKWGKAGIVFKGIGNAIRMSIEGMYIARNYFSHAAYPGQRGLYLHGQEFLKTQLGDISMDAMTIEFWIRPDWDFTGKDSFNDFKFRALFHFSNVANDIFGAAISVRGIEVYYGNLFSNLNTLVISNLPFSPADTLVHMAFVCSNTGEKISSDSSTVRVYINNTLAGKADTKWEVSDNKYIDFKLGGQGIIPIRSFSSKAVSSSIDGVVCRLKIHNFCKTDFTEAITDSSDNYKGTLTKPSEFVEISSDNVTYHRVDSPDLPFFFEDVPAESSIPIWVRVVVPKGLSGSEKRTAQLIGSWDIGV